MKHVDEYRNNELSLRLLDQIRQAATKRWCLMEVCGGQTHSLLKHGIDEALRDTVHLLHGPGCPVCVTPECSIDSMVSLSRRPDVIVASFGDMLRVPGTGESLLQAKSAGAEVRIVYSPLDVLKIAQANPQKEVVFFAVGFETTVPATALAVQQAARLGLSNFSLLVSHVRVLPAMELIVGQDDCGVDGFLGAGHVCTITGFGTYHEFVKRYQKPVAITGFEPVDLLRGLLACIEMLERKQPEVINTYERSVQPDGNTAAMRCIQDVYEVVDSPWRGLGTIQGGGFDLRAEYQQFCAKRKFSLPILDQTKVGIQDQPQCMSGSVMTGRIRPSECPHFGIGCTPESPMGAPMVSSEGACSAYYRYQSPIRKGV